MAEAETQSVISIDTFRVDPEACIACDACCQDFPEIFYMGDDQKAHALDDQKADLYNARTVVEVCPTDAIHYSGELPPAEDIGALEEVPGWEAVWAKWRHVEEDRVERDRRYGRDYTVEEEDGYVQIRLQLPTKVPAVRDRFKYGLPEVMPDLGSHVYQRGNQVKVTAWVKDPKVKNLCHTSSSFPGQFTVGFDLPEGFVGMKHRHDAHGVVDVILFTDRARMENWEWRAHFITTLCTSCSICERVCPTNAITSGEERYHIEPDLCINCSVCGVYCPFDAIDDAREVVVQKIKPKKVPKAEVYEELCTGCEYCVDVCPFEALEMVPAPGFEGMDVGLLPQNNRIAAVIEKNCISCKLCEQVCIKDAVVVPREHQFEDIGMSFMNYLTDEH